MGKYLDEFCGQACVRYNLCEVYRKATLTIGRKARPDKPQGLAHDPPGRFSLAVPP